MSRMGAIFLFLFLFNAVLNLLVTLGIGIGGVTPLMNTADMTTMTATSTWYNATTTGWLGALGYFILAAEMMMFAVLLFLQTIYTMTVGAPAFYADLFEIVVGPGVVTTAFTALFTLVSNYITLMGILEIIGGKNTET